MLDDYLDECKALMNAITVDLFHPVYGEGSSVEAVSVNGPETFSCSLHEAKEEPQVEALPESTDSQP